MSFISDLINETYPEDISGITKVEIKLEDFSFINNYLSFKVVRYTYSNIPFKYKTIDYEKFPIEWRESIRTKTLLQKNKNISKERFCETEIRSLGLDLKIINLILKKLDYTPSWKKKELDIAEKQKIISNYNSQIRPLISIKEELQKIKNSHEIKITDMEFEILDIKDVKSSLPSFIFRIIFSIPTLFLCWIGFISKKTAAANQIKKRDLKTKLSNANKKNNLLLVQKMEEFTKENLNIVSYNKKTESIIKAEQKSLRTIEEKNYSSIIADDGFIDLRQALKTITPFSQKGVYIIWNKSKNKYYVGQSKDLYKRIFTQHFRQNDVGNIIFAKDWWDNDDFFYKIFDAETKDQLDSLEKKYIDLYNSFSFGYNKTSGNE